MNPVIKSVLLTAVAVIIGLIAYDFLLKPMLPANFEQDNNNYEVDAAGNIMKVA